MWQCDSDFSSFSQNTSLVLFRHTRMLQCCPPWPLKSPHNMLSPSHILFLQRALCTHSSCSLPRAERNDREIVFAWWFSVGVLMAGMCQGQKFVSSASRISPLNTKKCQLPTGLTQTCQRAAVPVNLSWPTSDAPQSNMMDHLPHHLTSHIKKRRMACQKRV